MIYLIIFLTIPYLFLKCKGHLHVLQQNFYNENNRYISWGWKNKKEIFNGLELLIIGINLLNLYLQNNYLLLVNILYLLLFYLEYKEKKETQVKIPLKVTKRIKRLIVTIFILYLIPVILIFLNKYIILVIYLIMLFINYYVVYLANVINIPLEKIVFLSYKTKAMRKLKKMNHMEVIGITGSYGKTSSKNILNEILNVKFNALATPKNYNTQYGLILTINNYLDKFNDYFIAEMGAFKKGRIKLLCDLVKPKYGIITWIGDAHLETFGSKKNIQEGKFELIESLPSDGVAILNKDDEYQVNYKLKNNCAIIWIGIKNKDADIVASNIKMNKDGMSFICTFKSSGEKINLKTSLLGEANIYNILSAIALGKYFKMQNEDIERGVRLLKPTEHRLELKKLNNLYIIDDAYNSNPIGSEMALNVLNLMDGYKVVVTPGMIELGDEEYKLNKEFGEKISKVADLVILVGEKQTKPIYDGLMKMQYNKDNLIVVNEINEAFKIINNLKWDKDTYILLENDLPDIYNEKDVKK